MSEYPIDFLNAYCPSRKVFTLLANKWALLTLAAISRGVLRNGELMREIGDVSQKMLTQTLRNLEQHGLINRNILEMVPPHVEYTLTPLGESLIPIIKQMGAWAENNYEAFPSE